MQVTLSAWHKRSLCQVSVLLLPLLPLLLLPLLPGVSGGEDAATNTVTVGYLTGSRRIAGDLTYSRPGRTISGAILLAIDEVNKRHPLVNGYRLQLRVGETFGRLNISVSETVSLYSGAGGGGGCGGEELGRAGNHRALDDNRAMIRREPALGDVAVADVIIGPQETCLHEATIAASLNRPMISYYCTDSRTSDKTRFPTFARTRPPDRQICTSVLALLKYFGWRKVALVRKYIPDSVFDTTGRALVEVLTAGGVQLTHDTQWTDTYHHPYMTNPFVDIIGASFQHTRIYLILGEHFEIRAFLLTLRDMGILAKGEHFVVGVDLQRYKQHSPESYLRSLLHAETSADKHVLQAFKYYLGVIGSATVSFDHFASLVSHYSRQPPFNHTSVLQQLGHATQVSVEAAYLYDAVMLYSWALNRTLQAGGDKRDGSSIVQTLANHSYHSAMGYTSYMDANGDAQGNYTVIRVGVRRGAGGGGEEVAGLYPVGLFKMTESSGADSLRTVLELQHTIEWPAPHYLPPRDEPYCGFDNQLCRSYEVEIGVVLCTTALVASFVAFIGYRNWRYRQQLDALSWKIDYSELVFAESKPAAAPPAAAPPAAVRPDSRHILPPYMRIQSSQVSLSSNCDNGATGSTDVYTSVAKYRGKMVAIKFVHSQCPTEITGSMKKSLKQLRDINHDNLNRLVGVCVDMKHGVCTVTEYCCRGSIRDIIEKGNVKLDSMFLASMVFDIIRGLSFLHESSARYHGNLKTTNCLVDSRWSVRLADFGLQCLSSDQTVGSDTLPQQPDLLFMAPELLQLRVAASHTDTSLVTIGNHGSSGSGGGSGGGSGEKGAGGGGGGGGATCDVTSAVAWQQADVYSLSMVLYELTTGRRPFSELGLSWSDIIACVVSSSNNNNSHHSYHHHHHPPLRPVLSVLSPSSLDCVRHVMKDCWNDAPSMRPDIRTIRVRLRPMRKGLKPHILDNMISLMERYTNNLESIITERTRQLYEEQQKTEALLCEMLPGYVVSQLKLGRAVQAESFHSVTVYFSDIVGFTALCANSTPLQVVDFLNSLYTCFDAIVDKYDVYKVETIGDAYMVASGLPVRNGLEHAGQIASMALHLLHTVASFRIAHRPADTLLLRIGIHTGPVCAGVVGCRMPRYCLYGDTVNTASRMESTGEPLRVHCSSACKAALDKLGGGYITEERGLIPIKGKGEMLTYWLLGETRNNNNIENKQTNKARAASIVRAHSLETQPMRARAHAISRSCRNPVGILPSTVEKVDDELSPSHRSFRSSMNLTPSKLATSVGALPNCSYKGGRQMALKIPHPVHIFTSDSALDAHNSALSSAGFSESDPLLHRQV